jgi:hypothetical protein
MQRLILGDVTAITGTNTEALKSQRRRGQCAFAFGSADASARCRYVPADVVAVMLTKELAQTYGAKQAARLVIMFADVVLRAVALSEADTTTDLMISVADVEHDGRHGHLAYIGRNADAAEVADDYIIERVVSVNVTRTIKTIRACASAEHIDLSGAFMPVPGSAEFDEIMSPFAKLPSGIVEISAFRQRVAAARRAGERARLIAMGGRVAAGNRAKTTSLVAA